MWYGRKIPQKFFCELIFFFVWKISFQGATVLGNPTKVDKIGETFIPYQVFKDCLRGLADSTFR